MKGGGDNYFSISDSGTLTHVRLNIYPDGGVARLRVYGEVAPDWEKICSSKGAVDLAAIEHGGRVLCCNDMFFGPKDNLILPGLAKNMGDGWETRRRRVPGHDWIVIRLGTRGAIQKIEVDTSFFKGNFPESCSIDGCIDSRRDMTADEFSNVSHDWKEILPRTKLRAHHRHLFQKELSRNVLGTGMDFIRLNIYPDGGVSRLRVYGVPLR